MKYFFLLLFAITMASCETENTSNNANTNSDATEKPTESKPEKTDNWLIIPGKQVGRIQADFSAEDIFKMFGDDNVMETEIGLGEGEMKKGLIVFPKTKNELQVLFEGEDEMKKLESIRIYHQDALWKTESGVEIGTPLEKLVELNGKQFSFLGFEWDYAGRLDSWNEGKLSEDLLIYLSPTNEAAIYPDLLGDVKFSSDHPKAKEGELKVICLEILFNHYKTQPHYDRIFEKTIRRD